MAKKGIVSGTTSTGFEYSVKKAMLENAEFLELFAKVQDGDQLKIFELIELSLGSDQKKALYDHVRDEDGMVPVEALSSETAEIFEELGKDDSTKN